jgi:hypothetical protein
MSEHDRSLSPNTNTTIDFRPFEPAGQRRAQQEVINAQTGIPGKGTPEVIPKCVHACVRMKSAQCIDPALLDQAVKSKPDFWTE